MYVCVCLYVCMYVCMYVCKYRGIYFAKSKLRLKSAELAAAQGKDAHASHRRLPSSHLVFDAVSEVGLYNAAIAILKNDPQLQCWVRCPPYPPIVSNCFCFKRCSDAFGSFGSFWYHGSFDGRSQMADLTIVVSGVGKHVEKS